MSDDKDKKAPEGEEERTVFMPSGGGETPAPPKSNFFETDDAPPAPPAPTPPAPPAPAPPPEVETPPEAAPDLSPESPAESPSEPSADVPEQAAAEPVEEAAPDAPADADANLSDPEPPPIETVPSDPEPPAPETETAAEEQRTVFAPSPAEAAAPAAETPATPPPATPEEPRTVFAPSPAEAAPPAAEAPAPPPPPPATPTSPEAIAAAGATASGTATRFTPVEHARDIKVGDVLNHIFEVKRFLARGGMGEVFEGCNVNTDERVAIKVMLPAMAADEKIVAMFRKEARTLTKLQHEALISYRVLAQEPQLGVLYIVTEFIEGVELGEMLGRVERTPEELAGLLKRLASGLAHAHRIGAIHRDISPDNVLLPGGDVHQATIIDFGIAKDLDASSATIVGDGFAGKLNYVAPEQLGDYGREVGPWTDVYSLALVMLAVAQGKNVNMSGSLVDAIDKRRKGPDLSPVPGNIRPVLEAMLRPDPKDRLRSMEDVLAMLGGERAAPPPPPPPSSPTPAVTERKKGSSATPALIGGLVAVGLLAAAGAWYAFGGLGGEEPKNQVGPVGPVTPGGDPVETARNAINAALPSVGCTWLDISRVENANGGMQIALRGVAGEGEAARQEISRALSDAGIRNAQLDFGDVAPITQAGCAALDAYRQVRATAGTHLSVPQPRFEMMMQPAGLPYAGEQAANAVINFNFANAQDFAILGIEPSGVISPLIADRATFESALAQSVGGRPITDEGNGRYRLNIDLDHSGWSGIILVTGQAPFERDLVAPPVGVRGPSWRDQFLARAAERNWRVEMVWFESVNNVAGDTAPAPTATAPVASPPPPPADQPADDSADDDKPPAQ